MYLVEKLFVGTALTGFFVLIGAMTMLMTAS